MNDSRQRRGPETWRIPFVAGAIACLAAAVWGGLVRLPVDVPLPGRSVGWAAVHGPLMVCAFLGTVISLERAVGLPWRWPYLAPLLCIMAGAHLVAGGGGRTAAALFSAASLVSVGASLQIMKMRTELYTRLLVGGTLSWLLGNLLWLTTTEIQRSLPWWMAFLLLTIVGERVELGRFQKTHPWAPRMLTGCLTVLGLGLGWVMMDLTWGQRVFGVALIGLAAWLIRFDSAWRQIRSPGLPRFMSIFLLIGFFWLSIAGLLLTKWAPVTSGFYYDATLHAFFVGFVISMIFSHAPVIFPGVLGLRMAWSPIFYLHGLLLQLSLLLRVGGDLLEWLPGRRWGGVLNSLTLLIFAAATASVVWRTNRQSASATLPGAAC